MEFNEQTLLSDIIKRWGNDGAHAVVMRWLIDECVRLSEENGRLNEQLDRALAVLDRNDRKKEV